MFKILLIFFSLKSFASEAPAPAAAPAGGEPAVSLESKEYREKTAKLSGLEAKIADSNKTISEMIEKKRLSKDVEKTREIMAELVTLSEERNKMVKEHAKLKQFLLYRFPNLGETVAKRYGVHEEMSVDQHERASGIDELLTEVKEVIRQKYSPILDKDKKDSGDSSDSVSAPVTAEPKEKPLRLVK